MSGAPIKVTVTDVLAGESAERTIEDNYILVTAGRYYLDGIVKHANGTVVLTVKVRKP